MGKQSLVSDTISSTRILSHGKIKSLADGFSLPNLVNFILYVRPKDNVEINASDIILSVNCMKDDGFKEAPFKLNEWSPLYLEEIAAGQDEILSKVDLFWGAGDFIIKGKGEVKTKPCAKVLTYTGEAQELVTAGEGTGTMLYKLGDGEWNENIPSAVNVGAYEVGYKVAESEFYEACDGGALRCAIVEKFLNTPKIVLTPNSFAYTGEACVPTVEVYDGERLIPANEYTVELANNINAGTATVTIKDNIAGNYEVLGSTTFNIAKAKRSISFVSAPKSVDVDDSVVVAAVVSAGGGNISYFSSDENIATVEDNVVTGVAKGTCNIIASVAANANYEGATAQYQIAAVPLDYSNKYLTFIPVEDSTFGFSKEGLSYSLDNGSTWTELAKDGTTPTVAAGSKILWKNNTTLMPVSNSGIGRFSSDKNFDAQGNIMSLYFGDDFVGQTSLGGKGYSFNFLFSASQIRNAKDLILPATTLADYCYSHMFYWCSSLISTPELPATKLAYQCYSYMFQNCKALTTAPKLPATTLAEGCYLYMFNCTALTTAPKLPATNLSWSAYLGMFSSCTSLTTAPELPATKIPLYCYQDMFRGCTSLTEAPELPATTLDSCCYAAMFLGCTSLTEAPELPATTLKGGCYQQMFYRCTSLTKAPELPATKLAGDCYRSMFNECAKLNYVKMLATDISANNCLTNWLESVPASGTFVKAEGVTLPSGASGIPEGWTVVNESDEHLIEYLTFIPVEDSTFSFTKAGLSYSTDNGSTWTELAANGTTPTVTAGSKIQWKNNTELTTSSSTGIGTFSSNKMFDVKGNILSLLFGDDFIGQTSLKSKSNVFMGLFRQAKVRKAQDLTLPATTLTKQCYNSMFRDCYWLTAAPTLPATTISDYCYGGMFGGCYSLTTAPELPATTLGKNCYYGMFKECESLTTAPELPATTLTSYCYCEMFYGCRSLNYVKMLATDISAEYCLTDWLCRVSASGTFVKAQGVTIPSGNSGIREGWTVETYTPAA